MNKTYFLSDCHLSQDRPKVTELFKQCIRDIHGADALYILGDLFDVWVGDDHITQTSIEVQNALQALHNSGTQIFFIKGNRDFLLGKSFAKEAKWQVLSDYFVASHYGFKALLCHGDTLCTDDVAYLKFRKVIRNPLVLFVYRHLPLFYRKHIAKKLRQKSMQYQKTVDKSIIDVTQDAVETALNQYGVNTLIHGHTHRPKHHQFKDTSRYVLGDWHETSAKIIELSTDGFKLVDYANSALVPSFAEPSKDCA